MAHWCHSPRTQPKVDCNRAALGGGLFRRASQDSLSLGRFVLPSNAPYSGTIERTDRHNTAGEVGMEKKRIEKFKKQLLERRQELLKSIAQTQEEGRAMQHSYGPDEGDRANSSLDKELLFHPDHPLARPARRHRCCSRPHRGRNLRSMHGLRRRDRREKTRSPALDALLHFLSGEFREESLILGWEPQLRNSCRKN